LEDERVTAIETERINSEAASLQIAVDNEGEDSENARTQKEQQRGNQVDTYRDDAMKKSSGANRFRKCSDSKRAARRRILLPPKTNTVGATYPTQILRRRPGPFGLPLELERSQQIAVDNEGEDRGR